jgi:hypothetical protein
METSILAKLIIKTGALLALGFGEAGSKIIAENMNRGINSKKNKNFKILF